MRAIAKKIFDFFLYSSLYIACCAVVMIMQVNAFFNLHYPIKDFFLFVFAATLCSYSFHWYLTPYTQGGTPRITWNERHRKLLVVEFFIGMVASLILFIPLSRHWWQISIAIGASFIYSAPKIPLKPFQHLQRIAYGKTLFLTFVWMYVTTMLPILISDQHWTWGHSLFCMSRFFLIYAICCLFDYRDVEEDRKQGIRSLLISMSEKSIPYLFGISLFLFFLCTIALYFNGFSVGIISILLLPGLITGLLYPYATRHNSDYLYYFILDGMMMFSSLITVFVSI